VIQAFSDCAAVHDLYPTFSGTLCFDIGANAGFLAATFAEQFVQVIAIEPCEESFTQIPHRPNIVAHNVAVSSHAGTVVLLERERSMRHGELVTGASLGATWGEWIGERRVPCMTLDALAREFGEPNFVKVDTEGHELAVLAGGVGVLDSHPHWLIEVHEQRQGELIQAMLAAFLYDVRVIHHDYYPHGSYMRHNHYWIVAK
jgi:FkbM family methyltransferase